MRNYEIELLSPNSKAASFTGTYGSDLTVNILPRCKELLHLLLFKIKYHQRKSHRKDEGTVIHHRPFNYNYSKDTYPIHTLTTSFSSFVFSFVIGVVALKIVLSTHTFTFFYYLYLHFKIFCSRYR